MALARIGFSAIGGFGFAVTVALAALMQLKMVDAAPALPAAKSS